MYIIYLHIDLSIILHTTEAVMALHSIYKPLAPKKIYPQLSEWFRKLFSILLILF